MNAVTKGRYVSDDAPPRNPITGIAACCARAASGHPTAAPPIRVMNSRRLIGFLLQAEEKSYHTDERERHFASPQKWDANVRVGSLLPDQHAGDAGGMSAFCSESDGRPNAIRRGMQRRR